MKSIRRLTPPEILIVIGMGVVVAVMLLFAVRAVVGIDFKRTQAKNDVTQIANAVAAFETEYGHFPGTGRQVVGGGLLAALMGSNAALNPRGLVFIEVNAARSGRSGLRGGDFVDPWGGAYWISLANGTNLTVIAGTNGVEIRRRVGVWNDPDLGADAGSLSPAKKQKRGVNSWE